MTRRTRLGLPIVTVALVGLGVALWLGPGQAMDTNPCDHDCPLSIVHANLSVEPTSGTSRSPDQITLEGVIVPPRDCASATIAIDVYAEASSRGDREWIGHGSATTENLQSGQDWPFQIAVSGTDLSDRAPYAYDISELSCRRSD
jgi:hypothetical protein